MDSKNTKIAVLGDGGWGTTLSILLFKKGYKVSLWSAFPDYTQTLRRTRENIKFLPQFKIPEAVHITDDIKEAIDGAEIVVVAIPSQFVRKVLQNLKDVDLSQRIMLSVVKGVEKKTLKRVSEIIKEEINTNKICILSGPTIALEVAKEIPASAVVASEDINLAKQMQDVFMTERFRIYTSTDVIGVELGGSLKNIIAIAAGISDGLGFGTNAKAALFTRGLVEIKRLGIAIGAKEETFNGLSGIGDLMTTCISPYSRNRYVGEEIAKGRKLTEIVQKMEQIAEGIHTTESACELAKRYNVEMPITEQVYKVLFENKNALEAVIALMTRAKKAE
ncbi:MAG: NAD(P)-dependent glycerol-3-phosphate dehydrogenase [Candidatus Omnitrophota bacterium]|nr:MAG: NAD(P)-dependent glycerol-3-phosphate dehydrogenase [Candidatus Omnitrophota bacterium]